MSLELYYEELRRRHAHLDGAIAAARLAAAKEMRNLERGDDIGA